MFKSTVASYNKRGAKHPFLIVDKNLKSTVMQHSVKTMKRQGLTGRAPLVSLDKNFARNYEHAFPLLSHTDFGHNNQAMDTTRIQLANYMPKKAKGTAPWFRGADTYSVLYSEQGRYEYQRYLMIERMPSEYKEHFVRYLAFIRQLNEVSPSAAAGGVPSDGTGDHIPQEALHWILRMIVDNFNPQHVHYQAAMATLTVHKEYDMARDIWRVMERQQTVPDDKLIVQYLELLATMGGEKALAIECWNRYCNEKNFLQEGEVDPKPISRVPFTLNRDETLYLPKWKKHFDHDPNLDVNDLNRFNTTRDIYRAMAGAMLAAGDLDMFKRFSEKLFTGLSTTPTPVPEPPNPHLAPKPKWGPHHAQDTLQRSAWRPQDSRRATSFGARHSNIEELHRRFHSNDQFLLTSVAYFVSILQQRAVADPSTAEEALKLIDSLVNQAFTILGADKVKELDTRRLFTTVLASHRTISSSSQGGNALKEKMKALLQMKGTPDELPHSAMYLEILNGFAGEATSLASAKKLTADDCRRLVQEVSNVIREMSGSSAFVWSADIHLAIMKVLGSCGTMKANQYFVKNVLREFQWDSSFCEVLYDEYQRIPDVELWAEHTKRMLVWTARYNVTLSEEVKRVIEDDYDIIGVQVRSMRELVVFRHRDMEEKRIAQDPTSQLPNHFNDYVSHALPFPDREYGSPDHYGDLGQWRTPESGQPTTPIPEDEKGHRGQKFWQPATMGEAHKGYTAEWTEKNAKSGLPKLPTPWDRKYAQYKIGTTPSYDTIYAGPSPVVFPTRYNFRRQTRWDYRNVAKQSKYQMANPF